MKSDIFDEELVKIMLKSDEILERLNTPEMQKKIKMLDNGVPLEKLLRMKDEGLE